MMKDENKFNQVEEVEEVEEPHLFKGMFFALLFEAFGIMVIWGLIKILMVLVA